MLSLLTLFFSAILLTSKATILSVTHSVSNQNVVITLNINTDTETVDLTLSGPATRWFGVGFGSTTMQNTYAIITDNGQGTNTITERKLGQASQGNILSSTINIQTDQTINNTRIITIQRNRIGSNNDYYTFPNAESDINIIWAFSNSLSNTFAYHGSSLSTHETSVVTLIEDASQTTPAPTSTTSIEHDIITDFEALDTTANSSGEPLPAVALTTSNLDASFMVILVAIVFLFICLSFLEYVGNQCNISWHTLGIYSTDQSHFILLITASFRVVDFITDIALAYEILLYSQKDFDLKMRWDLYTVILAINSIVWIFLPYTINWIALKFVIKMNTTASRPNIWFKKYMFVPVLLILMTGDCYISMKICCSNLFGSKMFDSGHTRIELEKIQMVKIWTIMLENIPQVIVQLVYGLVFLQYLGPLILASLLFSTLSSVSEIITFICVSNSANKCQTISYQLIVTFDNSRSNNYGSKTQELLQIQRYRGCKNQLKTKLCLLLGVDKAQIEIGYVDLKSNGCVVNIIHTIPIKKTQNEYVIHSYIDNLYENKLDELCIILQSIYHLLWHVNYNVTISMNGNMDLNANEINKMKQVVEELVNDVIDANNNGPTHGANNANTSKSISIELAQSDIVDAFSANYPSSLISMPINELNKDSENYIDHNLTNKNNNLSVYQFKFGDTFSI